MRRRVVALVVSDLHLWHRPPAFRAAEPDWWAAMRRPLDQLRDDSRDPNGDGKAVPVVYAGDLFDRWNCPPELVSFAIRNLPWGYAVPGQHDLPWHSYSDVKRSAYWSLVEAGVIENLRPGRPVGVGTVRLHGFPWGVPVAPPGPNGICLEVAVVHAYCWARGCSHPGAREEDNHARWRDRLCGYDVAFFGDNHRGFTRGPKPGAEGAVVVNCGTMMRRKSDEADYAPRFLRLHDDGGVESVGFDVSGDVCSAVETTKPTSDRVRGGHGDFISGLSCLGAGAVDFRKSVYEYMDAHGTAPPVRKRVLQAMGE